MVKKLISYILIIIGLVAIAYYVVPQINVALKPYAPSGFTDTYIVVGGIIIFILGVYLMSKGRRGRQHGYEVPIYHGGKVVGYRRN